MWEVKVERNGPSRLRHSNLSELQWFVPRDRHDEHLAVADAPGAGDLRHHLAQRRGLLVRHPYRDFDFGEIRGAVLRTAIAVEVAFLTAVPFRLAHRARGHA